MMGRNEPQHHIENRLESVELEIVSSHDFRSAFIALHAMRMHGFLLEFSSKFFGAKVMQIALFLKIRCQITREHHGCLN